jgi:hypothetical protein
MQNADATLLGESEVGSCAGGAKVGVVAVILSSSLSVNHLILAFILEILLPPFLLFLLPNVFPDTTPVIVTTVIVTTVIVTTVIVTTVIVTTVIVTTVIVTTVIVTTVIVTTVITITLFRRAFTAATATTTATFNLVLPLAPSS